METIPLVPFEEPKFATRKWSRGKNNAASGIHGVDNLRRRERSSGGIALVLVRPRRSGRMGRGLFYI